MHRAQAGHATATAIWMRISEQGWLEIGSELLRGYLNVLISHHTGAQLMAFPLHMMESTKWTRQPRAVQTMYIHVPTFHDSKCHHKGTREMTTPIPEKTVNTVFETVISKHC
jgi:hypothetical protein